MKTKILNLSDAYKLYLIMKPVYPRTNEDDLLGFLHELFENIRSTDDMITVEILKLLLGVSEDKIEELEFGDVLDILLDGFTKNRIVSLFEFFNGLLDNG